MTDDRDPLLQTLFAEAQQELDGTEFVRQVMLQAGRQRHQVIAYAALAVLVIACGLVLTQPLQEFALLLAQGLTTTLVDLGDGWLSFLISPINNVASLVILSLKALRSGHKRFVGASYA